MLHEENERWIANNSWRYERFQRSAAVSSGQNVNNKLAKFINRQELSGHKLVKVSDASEFKAHGAPTTTFRGSRPKGEGVCDCHRR